MGLVTEESCHRWRQAVRILEMVSVLHAGGLKRIRAMPYLHPLAWRVAIGPSDVFDRHGVMVAQDELDSCAVYSTASGASCFGWADASHDDATALAVKFADRFPCIAVKGAGNDPRYAAWLTGLLSSLPDGQALPLYFSDDRPYDPRRPEVALMSTTSGAICGFYPAPPSPPEA